MSISNPPGKIKYPELRNKITWKKGKINQDKSELFGTDYLAMFPLFPFYVILFNFVQNENLKADDFDLMPAV
ncbi:hypothetical protein RSJ42_11365 [Methanosarcina hadiensis]|uniref:hypothetical protein n=1 Tax=Methanosarcina hadiensis TaxID=3078083 RepID=UPI0039775144